MKKVIVSSLAILMLGAAVIYADSVSLVGRKVQSEAAITLDGKEIGSVLIIDGVSYAPVRVIAEASGLTAGYAKGEVKLTTNESIRTSETIDEDALTKEKNRLVIQSDTLRNYIRDLTNSIATLESEINKFDGEVEESYRTMISDAKSSLTKYESELAEAERRIAEIDELLK